MAGATGGWPRVGRSLLALALGAVVLAALAVLVASAYEGWVLAHPPVRPVAGNPGLGAQLAYRCLPVPPAPQFCAAHPRPLFTPVHHVAIPGWIVPAAAARYPGLSGGWSRSTVVLIGDYGQNRIDHAPFPTWHVVTRLHAAGYNVVLFDSRGTGAADGGSVGFGTVEVHDLLTVVRYLRTLGPPQGDIALWGLGTGADAAIMAAARTPLVRAVIADSPYATLGGFLRRAVPYFSGWPAFPFQYTVPWVMSRETGVAYGRYNPLQAVRALGAAPARPLLLVAGTADPLAPLSDAQRLFRASHDPRADLLPVYGAGRLQAYAKSPRQVRYGGPNVYMCHVLTTLAAMHRARVPAAASANPCGGSAAAG